MHLNKIEVVFRCINSAHWLALSIRASSIRRRRLGADPAAPAFLSALAIRSLNSRSWPSPSARIALVVRNLRKMSFVLWKVRRYFSMYSSVSGVWLRYWAIRLKSIREQTHCNARLKGCCWEPSGFRKADVNTAEIQRPRFRISLPCHCVSSR